MRRFGMVGTNNTHLVTLDTLRSEVHLAFISVKVWLGFLSPNPIQSRKPITILALTRPSQDQPKIIPGLAKPESGFPAGPFCVWGKPPPPQKKKINIKKITYSPQKCSDLFTLSPLPLAPPLKKSSSTPPPVEIYIGNPVNTDIQPVWTQSVPSCHTYIRIHTVGMRWRGEACQHAPTFWSTFPQCCTGSPQQEASEHWPTWIQSEGSHTQTRKLLSGRGPASHKKSVHKYDPGLGPTDRPGLYWLGEVLGKEKVSRTDDSIWCLLWSPSICQRMSAAVLLKYYFMQGTVCK